MERLGIDIHRFGTGLLVFGLVGILLAGAVAIGLVASAASIRSLEGSLEDDRQAAIEALDTVSVSLGHAAQATGNLRTTLGTTQTTLQTTGETLDTFAETSDALAEGLAFSILGQQPLAEAGRRFEELADQLRTFSEATTELAGDLAMNQQDLVAITTDLRELQRQVDQLAARLADFDGTGRLVGLLSGGILLLAGLAAWVAAAGALCAWLGWRLRRPVVVTATPVDPGA
jgi:hypothetical protein